MKHNNHLQKKVTIEDLENVVGWDFSQIYQEVKEENQLQTIDEAKQLMQHHYDVVISINLVGSSLSASFQFISSTQPETSNSFLLEDKDQVINDMYKLMNQNKTENYEI